MLKYANAMKKVNEVKYFLKKYFYLNIKDWKHLSQANTWKNIFRLERHKCQSIFPMFTFQWLIK